MGLFQRPAKRFTAVYQSIMVMMATITATITAAMMISITPIQDVGMTTPSAPRS